MLGSAGHVRGRAAFLNDDTDGLKGVCDGRPLGEQAAFAGEGRMRCPARLDATMTRRHRAPAPHGELQTRDLGHARAALTRICGLQLPRAPLGKP